MKIAPNQMIAVTAKRCIIYTNAVHSKKKPFFGTDFK